MDSWQSQSHSSGSPMLPVPNADVLACIRVLLVDDQKLVRQMLHLSLETELGIEVVGSADNGHTALELIPSLAPDIALVDIEMPGMDGLATTTAIRQRFPQTKVLVLSSHDQPEYVQKALVAGAQGYLIKSTPAEDLVQAIRLVHKGYVQFGPGLFEKLEAGSPLEQLAPVAQADEWSAVTQAQIDTLPAVWSRGLLYLLIGLIGVVLPWAMFSEVDETGTARGRLEPKGQTFRLDAPVEGKVVAIAVKEGSIVKAGQTLVELESEVMKTDLQQTQAKLEGQQNRLTQLEQLKSQLAIATRTQQLESQAQLSEQLAQADQVEARINSSRSAYSLAKARLAKELNEVKRYRQLAKDGVVSEVQAVEAERLADDSQRQAEQALADLQQAQSELKKQQSTRLRVERTGELSILDSRKQSKELQTQVADMRSEIAQTQKLIASLQLQLQQRIVRAPVSGTIFQLPIQRAGVVVKAGQTVAQIAPESTSLILRAKMPSSESGFLRLGMPVKLKFDAYPFQDYGVVPGNLRRISPDSNKTETPQGEIETFELEVELEQTYIPTPTKRIALTPGQTAAAEVVVRQRRIIDFLLDPFKKLQKGDFKL
jgi:hemolysin D